MKANHNRIEELLKTTRMTIEQIAYRLGITAKTVSRINKTQNVRQYTSRRGERWIVVATGQEVETEQ